MNLRHLISINISYEIVPGITAASGASAYTGVPLTARGYATGVNFLSCCCHTGHTKISDEEWKCLAEMKNTLVWYMTTKEWPSVARKLIFAGADGENASAGRRAGNDSKAICASVSARRLLE